jgi:hypothetical protein
MRRTFTTLAVTAVAGAGLFAAGCGDDEDKSAAPAAAAATQADSGAAKGKPSSETGASSLRATLTGLLEDHVYLAGIAVNTGLGEGLDSGAFKAAAGTLDKNSVALSKAIGGVYGDAAGDQFLALWRKHIGFFVNYAKGKATKDSALSEKALKDLDGYRTDFGAFISSANPNLPADAVAEELKPHIETLAAAIDAAASKSTTVFTKLQKAAAHMPMTAKILAGGIAKQYPDKFDGSADAGGSELRSGLTGLLTDHVYLASIAVDTGVKAGLTSKPFKAAAGALDDNSVALSKAIDSVYGDAAGEQFLALWRKHIGFFVDYAKGKATKDNALAAKALKDLDGYRADFGAFIASANPNLPQDAVAAELKPHVETLAAAIRADVAGSPKTFDRIAEAASHMPMTAKTLAGGITKQFPDKFPAS